MTRVSDDHSFDLRWWSVWALRTALVGLAIYNKPKPTACGFAIGVTGLLRGKASANHQHGCNCHASLDFVEVLAGGPFNENIKLFIPFLFIVAHLDRRLCCGTVEAATMGAMAGTCIWNTIEV